MKQIRNTEQKRIIAEALQQADHPTASALYESLRKQYPHMSRATVFRVLAGFVEGGTAQKLVFADDDTRFDPHTEPHDHFVCQKCGRIYDIPSTLETEETCLPEGFRIDKIQVQYTGLCPSCTKYKE